MSILARQLHLLASINIAVCGKFVVTNSTEIKILKLSHVNISSIKCHKKQINKKQGMQHNPGDYFQCFRSTGFLRFSNVKWLVCLKLLFCCLFYFVYSYSQWMQSHLIDRPCPLVRRPVSWSVLWGGRGVSSQNRGQRTNPDSPLRGTGVCAECEEGRVRLNPSSHM